MSFPHRFSMSSVMKIVKENELELRVAALLRKSNCSYGRLLWLCATADVMNVGLMW